MITYSQIQNQKEAQLVKAPRFYGQGVFLCQASLAMNGHEIYEIILTKPISKQMTHQPTVFLSSQLIRHKSVHMVIQEVLKVNLFYVFNVVFLYLNYFLLWWVELGVSCIITSTLPLRCILTQRNFPFCNVTSGLVLRHTIKHDSLSEYANLTINFKDN